jgi:hypothetical protein
VNVEPLEGKALLSTLPILSQGTVNQVLHQIDRAAGTFAKSHNENAFVVSLSQISTKVPYGHSQLFPTWRSDVGTYDPTVPGSGVTMVRQLKADLRDYVHTAVADGIIGLRGSGGLSVATSTSGGRAFVPHLSRNTYQNALRQIDRAAGTFAKSHSENAFVASLSQISTKLPYGHDQLFPTWQSDVGIYDPTVPGSGVTMVKQLKADLKDYVQTAIASGTFSLR